MKISNKQEQKFKNLEEFEKVDERQEIKDILFRNDKNRSWLKRELRREGYPSVDIHYLLSNKSVNFDTKLYKAIMAIFNREGFIVSESARCERFADQLIQVNGIISHSIYLLNSNASEVLKEEALDFRKKRKLLDLISNLREEFDTELDKIEKIIEQ